MMRSLLVGTALAFNVQELFETLKTAEYGLTAAEEEEHRAHFERLMAGKAAEDGQDVFDVAVPVVTEKLLAEIGAAANWVAGHSEHFAGWAVHDLKKILGSPAKAEDYMPLDMERIEVSADLPADFDSRTKWPDCPTIAHIRDQANCGSCWAFGSTEAFNDRLCIASGGKFTTMLSAQDTTSCCGFFSCFSQGCGGGQPAQAWKWLVSHGVVTGGDNTDEGKTDTCWPYEDKMCAHHVKSSKYPACPPEGGTPQCRRSCLNNGYSTPFTRDVHKGGRAYSLGSRDEIKQSIFEKGPVTGAFTVYADFPAYQSGVYEHKSGGMLGGHAIKIYGWGQDNGVDYWLVANSWNEEWGDAGSFKIKMGDSGIDDMISAGDVEATAEALVI